MTFAHTASAAAPHAFAAHQAAHATVSHDVETHAAEAHAVALHAIEPQARRGTVQTTLNLRHAGAQPLRIAYELLGADNAPVVIVAGGISADRHVLASAQFPQPGWWQVQSGLALDARRQRILAIDWLGADGALDAPIDSADQADAIAAVLDALGIARAAAFVGASYGAMVGLQFAARYPQRLRQLIAISGAHRAHPYASAWRALQRRIVALGQLQCDERDGLSLARQLAMLSYRTPAEFAERFATPPRIVHGRVRVAAEEYLEHCGDSYAERVPAQAFLRLSESIDLHWVAPRSVRVPTTVIGIAEDRLVPIEDIHALVAALPNAQLRTLRSRYGHDAFLKEPIAIAAALGGALDAACADAAGDAA
jgi:homoserine O-acetyltransferase